MPLPEKSVFFEVPENIYVPPDGSEVTLANRAHPTIIRRYKVAVERGHALSSFLRVYAEGHPASLTVRSSSDITHDVMGWNAVINQSDEIIFDVITTAPSDFSLVISLTPCDETGCPFR